MSKKREHNLVAKLMAINFTSTNHECYACEKTCILEFPGDCSPIFGIAVAAASLAVYAFGTIALLLRLIPMMYRRARALKRFTIGCFFAFGVVRVIK